MHIVKSMDNPHLLVFTETVLVVDGVHQDEAVGVVLLHGGVEAGGQAVHGVQLDLGEAELGEDAVNINSEQSADIDM